MIILLIRLYLCVMAYMFCFLYHRQEEEKWMKIQVGDVLRIDNNNQIPVSFITIDLKLTELYSDLAHLA